MSDDAYSVCQHCFEATPGVFTVDGLTYCEDCHALVAPIDVTTPPSSVESGSGSSSRVPNAGLAPQAARRLSPMSLRTSSKGNTKNQVFVSPPIPPPRPSPKPAAKPNQLALRRRPKFTPVLNYENVRVLHRGTSLQFSGVEIGAGVHDGLNALWVREPALPPGKYTWVGAYKRQEGDFIVASRISRHDGPGSGIAFRFTREKLVSFLKSAIVNAPPSEAKIWNWILNSWTLQD